MKIPMIMKDFSIIEIILLILFISFIIFPINIPDFLAKLIDLPLGMVFIFAITLSLFVYTNPILGVIYILVAYELFRRSSRVVARTAIIPYANASTTPQVVKDAEIKQLNPPKERTLEEEVISIRAPIGKSDQLTYIDSTFKPVSEKLDGASLF